MGDDLRVGFGRAVREARIARGISQETLAEAAAVDRTYVSSLERGGRNPALSTITRLARALGVQPFQLLQRADVLDDA